MVNPVVIEALETEIAFKRRELQTIQEDITILERAVAILKGRETEKSGMPIAVTAPNEHSTPESLPDVAAKILREVRRPLTGDQLIAAVRATGRDVNKVTLLGGIYRQIRHGKTFKLVGKGVFGLLEWDDHVEGNSKSKSASHANAPSGTTAVPTRMNYAKVPET